MTQAIGPTHNVTYDGVSVNVYHANKGHGLPRHKEWHEIEALEDGTVFVNIFSEGKY